MNIKSRNSAAQSATQSSAKLITDKKLSSFAQAKANARAARLANATVAASPVKEDKVMTEEEYERYVATCHESYDIMMEVFTLYTQHPDVCYVI